MPPAPLISGEKAVIILLKYKSYFESDVLPAYSHQVWTDIARECQNVWTPHNWYNKVKGNWKGILSSVKKQINIEIGQQENINSTLDSSVEVNDATFHIPERKERDNERWFDCFLSLEKWILLEPLRMDTLNKKISCKITSESWSYMLNTAFYKQQRLPCMFSFLGAEIDTSVSKFLKISGHCKGKTCKNEFYAYADTKPGINNDELHLHIRTCDTRRTEHEDMQSQLDRERKRQKDDADSKIPDKRRKVRPTKPSLVIDNSKVVESKKPVVAEQNSIKNDPINSVLHMQFEHPFLGSIHDISYNPFYVFYGLPAQSIVYKQYHKSTRSSSISIGVLNNCTKEVTFLQDLKSGSVSMYVIAVKFEKKLFPVYQMIGAEPGIEDLEFWVKRWIRRVNTIPKQVFIAYSETMLTACVRGFNDCTIEQYLDIIFISISENRKMPSNLTLLRIDFQSLMEVVCQWECLKSVFFPSVRAFYIKCIALLACSKNLTEFQEFFSLICIVSMQNYKDSYTSSTLILTVDDARKRLENDFIINNVNVEDYLKVYQNNLFPEKRENFDEKCMKNPSGTITSLIELIKKLTETGEVPSADSIFNDSAASNITKFISSVIASALMTKQKGSELNAYFLPTIMYELFQLGINFPIWTAVHIPTKLLEESGHHAREYIEMFQKKILSQYTHELKPDKFLRNHIRNLLENNLDITLETPILENETSRQDTPKNSEFSENMNQRCDKSSQGSPCDESSQEKPCDKSSQRSPCDKSSQRSPCDESSQEKPCDKSSQRSPRDKSSQRSPCDESSQDKPCDKSSQRSPCDKSSQRSPYDKSSQERPCDKSSQRSPCDKSSQERPCDKSSQRSPCDKSSQERPCDDSKCSIDPTDTMEETQSFEIKNNSGKEPPEFREKPDDNFEYSVREGESINNEKNNINSHENWEDLNNNNACHHDNNNNSQKEILKVIGQNKESNSKFFGKFVEAGLYNEQSTVPGVFFLRNAHLCPPVTLNKQQYKLSRTCAFDSICRLIIIGALDDPNYHTCVTSSENSLMKYITQFLTNASKSILLRERTRILVEHYGDRIKKIKTNFRTILHTLDTEDNVRNLWRMMLESEPSALRVFHCNNCGQREEPFDAFSPNHWIIARQGFGALQKALDFHPTIYNVSCKGCGGKGTLKTMPNFHVFIELDIRTGSASKQCPLKEFPREITLIKKYRLTGVIGYTPQHYMAYSCRVTGHWEYYNDLKEKVESRSSACIIEPHCALYTMQADS